MEVKINREIRNYTESMFFGLSFRQFVFSLLAVGVAIALYFVLKPHVGTETVSWMCILGAAPFAAMGFISYNGMTAEQFVWAWLRSEMIEPKQIKFEPVNIYYEALKDDFKTLHPDLAAEWSERNGCLLPDMINERSQKNVWWKCHDCGYEWKAVVKARVHGLKCPVCADRAVLIGHNDLATTDAALMEEWAYDMNTDIEPDKISRNSMRPVWWRCKFGHTWKEKICRRTVEGLGCPICDKEFARVLPQLLTVLYCGRLGLKVKINDSSIFGLPIDAYIPDLKLAMLARTANTKAENDGALVLRHQCKLRESLLAEIPITTSEDICLSVKRGFSLAHVYIPSDGERDIDIARNRFFAWRSNK